MIKDRFGGLFSGLTKRDIQTLTEFEAFITVAVDNAFGESEDDVYEWKRGDPILPDSESFSGALRVTQESGYTTDGAPGEFVSGSIEDIYKHFTTLYKELQWQCQQPPGGSHFEDQELDIEVKKQCRIWLSRIGPIIRKLKKLVDRSQNEELR